MCCVETIFLAHRTERTNQKRNTCMIFPRNWMSFFCVCALVCALVCACVCVFACTCASARVCIYVFAFVCLFFNIHLVSNKSKEGSILGIKCIRSSFLLKIRTATERLFKTIAPKAIEATNGKFLSLAGIHQEHLFVPWWHTCGSIRRRPCY